MDRTKSSVQQGILVEPQYRERVWGGHDLLPDSSAPIGEAWIVYEENKVVSGPEQGRTLGELAAEYGVDFLGRRVVEKSGKRFPLLIKLLDCHDWLSLQVHPDDAKAIELEGPGHFGKTEAWYFLKTEHDAKVISGLREGTTREEMAEAIRGGEIIDLARYQPLYKDDTMLTLAGTIHALGPGLLVYEIQQSSDITYRIFDWNRSQAAGRTLHIEQSIAVSDPALAGVHGHAMPPGDGERERLLQCPYFALDLLAGQSKSVKLDTLGETFHALTVIEGAAEVAGAGWSHRMGLHQTVVVPAACGAYTVKPQGGFRALLATVE